MPKPGQRADSFPLVQGLITEASPLNFPPQASADEQNFEIGRNGYRDRRRGLDRDVASSTVEIATSPLTASSRAYKWENVAGQAGVEFLVLQVNTDLHIFDALADDVIGESKGVINLGQASYTGEYDFAGIDGKLVITPVGNQFVVLEYNPTNDSFQWASYSLKIRDQWGVYVSSRDNRPNFRNGTLVTADTGSIGPEIYSPYWYVWVRTAGGTPSIIIYYGDNETPVIVHGGDIDSTTLDGYKRGAYKASFGSGTQHYAVSKITPPSGSGQEYLDWPVVYNLRNQSWGAPRKSFAGTLSDPLKLFANANGNTLPADNEQVWTALEYKPAADSSSAPFEYFSIELCNDRIGATSNIPKGYFIIDALNRAQSRESELLANAAAYSQLAENSNLSNPTKLYVAGGYEDRTTQMASCVTSYAGRAFFGGFGPTVFGDPYSPDLSNCILFSQIINGDSTFAKCYQEGDPTSRDDSDVVDTDGGLVKITDAKGILSMKAYGTALIVFASNGVWGITGGSDYGFSATNYKVNKLSSVGIISKNSIVDQGDLIFFWSSEGIFTVGKNQFGDLEVKNITSQTIQRHYDSIPLASKTEVFGTYDRISKKARWFYRVGNNYEDVTEMHELVLDTVLGAFTKNKFLPPFNHDIALVGAFEGKTYNDPDRDRATPSQCIRYVVFRKSATNTINLFVASFRDLTFRDWRAIDGFGSDAFAYGITGSVTAGDSGIAKQVPYVIMHFKRTENGVGPDGLPTNQSSCLIRTQWNWSDTIDSKKWSRLQQAYKYVRARYIDTSYDSGFETILTKNKVRGRGKSFALYFETEPGKDCRIIGWNITLNANTVT